MASASTSPASPFPPLPEAPVSSVKIALCQVSVGADKTANLAAARRAIDEAARTGAQLVCLPEIFNSPYATAEFPKHAEPVPAEGSRPTEAEQPSCAMLSEAARTHKVFLVGGSIPEVEEDSDGRRRFFNTCTVWEPEEGRLLAKFRKLHLFDIDIPGSITFRESDTLSPGDRPAVFDTPFGRVGLGICYDLRFPELALLLRAAGCSILVYPGAFNLTTGPAHWELLLRARALDNQLFVAAVSPARNPEASYQAWGHSTVVDPWGAVVATTEHEPALVVAELDLDRVPKVRAQIPVSFQRRWDLYAPPSWRASLVERTAGPRDDERSGAPGGAGAARAEDER